jgi:hypothetical protein
VVVRFHAASRTLTTNFGGLVFCVGAQPPGGQPVRRPNGRRTLSDVAALSLALHAAVVARGHRAVAGW